MAESFPLFHESIRDALRSGVAFLGGVKVVACQLRPQMEPDRAARWLANALDDSRPEKLEVEDIFWILRECRKKGYHAPAEYIGSDIGYQVTPVEPEDEYAALQRQFIESTNAQRTILERMERLAGKDVPSFLLKRAG